MAFDCKIILIDFDASKIFIELENWNSFPFNVHFHQFRQIFLYQEPLSDLVSHQIGPLNLVPLQTDAVGIGIDRRQRGRIHQDVQHLVLHGQNLLRDVDTFALLIVHLYCVSLLSTPIRVVTIM